MSSDQFCTFDTSFYAAASYVKCKCNILHCIEPVLHLFAASYVNAEFCNPRDEQIVYIYIARCIYISQHVHIFQFWRMVQQLLPYYITSGQCSVLCTHSEIPQDLSIKPSDVRQMILNVLIK